MPKQTLTNEAQVFVVQALACYESPSEVVKQVKEHFKIAMTLPAILHYDPTKAQGRDLSAPLTELFHELRAKFLSDLEDIPISNKAVRLRMLQRVADVADGRGAISVVLSAAEQAAKEMGGVYTNRRELTGAGGGPIQTQDAPVDLSGLSDEDLDALERLNNKALQLAADASQNSGTTTPDNTG